MAKRKMSINELDVFLKQKLNSYNFHVRLLSQSTDIWIMNFHKKMIKKYKEEINQICSKYKITNPIES